MTNDEINRKIAARCGWQISADNSQYKNPNSAFWQWRGYDPISQCIPNYCADLNAMHDAEATLFGGKDHEYAAQLLAVVNGVATDYLDDVTWRGVWDLLHATARQRAEAFLRTVGEWEEAK